MNVIGRAGYSAACPKPATTENNQTARDRRVMMRASVRIAFALAIEKREGAERTLSSM
jgi:hypothetical protein